MDKLHMETPDLTQTNIEKLAALFPACVTEARGEDGKLKKAVNFELLRQMLSDVALEGDEAYEFTWVGKKSAIVEANKPIRKTLRPCPAESVNWDSTENLYIEGDNLEALKLLQESYLGRVKMIYIDPPYNTGHDFIYNDRFEMDKQEYDQQTGLFDEEGNKNFVENPESNPRFHSDWCSMMYPRLMLARSILSDDGAIFISIDDNECANLLKMCSEVFGESNFVADISWQRTYSPRNDSKGVVSEVEHIIVYSKQVSWMPNYLPRTAEMDAKYKNPDNDIMPWTSSDAFAADASTHQGMVYAIQHPFSGEMIYPYNGAHWRYQQDTMLEIMNGWTQYILKDLPELSDQRILEQLNKVQRANQIRPSDKLEGRASGYNLTIEMETGVGKTYTYIKTMFELNKHYGWSKFIVVVPSVAIREGVYKSFEMTQEHFAEEYGKKIRFFIYNSAQLTEIDRFASDSSINVIIINSQAFNAKGKDARRIYMELDEFRSRRPIDIIAKTNPILIIDEPQSVEGKQTRERLKEFHPLLTLRYSATHKSDSIYNMVFRLDAMEAYNRKLVKKIAVKGITESGTTATDSFLYLENINLSKSDPTATLQFEVKMTSGALKKKSRIVKIGDNLYDYSRGLEEYRNGFVIKQIDGRDDSVEFLNGIKIFAGDVIGAVDEDQLRRIQIRETILSHIQRERQLFYKGIKVLSLFFIDEVANYREYDAAGQPVNGKYAAMFEEEYEDVIGAMQLTVSDDEYLRYLQSIPAAKTHAGYFSVDGKGKMVNSKIGRKETISDDVSAYELIMKNKELLLDRDPAHSPVRFIFSHSALREGWDNPNVFQICTLKQSGSDVRKRQEVGRGLRLCVNQSGERMDTNVLGNDVHNINILTVIASESYDSFARGLQTEMAEAVADRPRAVTVELFVGKVIQDEQGSEQVIDQDTASAIHYDMIINGYIDRKGSLTDKYYVKLPDGFYIATPVGRYNPDWAIAFYAGSVKHIYFVAETKGSMRSMQLRLIEQSKIHCAMEHFKAISDNHVVYDVVDSYQSLLEKVMR